MSGKVLKTGQFLEDNGYTGQVIAMLSKMPTALAGAIAEVAPSHDFLQHLMEKGELQKALTALFPLDATEETFRITLGGKEMGVILLRFNRLVLQPQDLSAYLGKHGMTSANLQQINAFREQHPDDRSHLAVCYQYGDGGPCIGVAPYSPALLCSNLVPVHTMDCDTLRAIAVWKEQV